MLPSFKIKRVIKKARGSLKSPFTCFWLGSVLLFILIALIAGSKLEDNKNYKQLAICENLDQPAAQSLFLKPGQSFVESPGLLMVQGCSLKSSATPGVFSPQILGSLIGDFTEEDNRNAIVEYIVEEGDTIASLSKKFGISQNTILWANNLSSGSGLKVGQKLIILPVSGVMHYVKSGDTISGLVTKYKGKESETLAFNNLSNGGDVYIGDIIIIPNGTMPSSVKSPTPNVWTPIADSYFICPISSPCKITQGLHFYNAIDFSHGKCGEPVYAAAAGTVLKAKITNSTSKWAFNGAGNHISIQHPNGVVTTYGHVLAALVNVGDTVSQGQIIALVGGAPGTPGAGMSTGCHLHFSVTGAKNPFSK